VGCACRLDSPGIDTLRHEQAEEEGLTCIDCHKGIAHKLPAKYDPEQDIPGESIYYYEANTSL